MLGCPLLTNTPFHLLGGVVKWIFLMLNSTSLPETTVFPDRFMLNPSDTTVP